MLRLVTIAITLLCTININCLPGDDVVVPQNRIFEDEIKEAIETVLKKLGKTHTFDNYDFELPSPWSGHGTVKKFKISGLNNWEVSDVYGNIGFLKLFFGAKIVYREIQGKGSYTVEVNKQKAGGNIRSDVYGLTILIEGTVDTNRNINITSEVTLDSAGIQVFDYKHPARSLRISFCLEKDFANYVNNHKSKISKAFNAIIKELIRKKHSSFTILADKLAKQIKH